MDFKAVIFDLNGTVLSDEYIYGKSFRKILKLLGKEVDKVYPHTLGIGVKENWEQLLVKYKIKTDRNTEELAKITQEEYLTHIKEIKLKNGFKEFIMGLLKLKIKTALATSNSWWVTNKLLSELNIRKYFDIVTTHEEIQYSKPSPDIYLASADKLKLLPKVCVVVEDSEAGIEAAKNARMKVIGMARDADYARRLKNADLIVFNYNQLTLQKIWQI